MRRITAEKSVLPIEKEATKVIINIKKKSIVFSKRIASRKFFLISCQGTKCISGLPTFKRAAIAGASFGFLNRKVIPWACVPIAQSSRKRRIGIMAARSSTSVNPVRTMPQTSSSAGKGACPFSANSAIAGDQSSILSPILTRNVFAKP